jgi:hypothetical protein
MHPQRTEWTDPVDLADDKHRRDNARKKTHVCNSDCDWKKRYFAPGKKWNSLGEH